ncbi:hypothetical protein OV207_21515 [Corallococcus sp. BB11-1]|uniref:hypothetical protein n=1 Tax=Corallococcus sp. BB11-1 TaxID=2996783 RepID=UPI002271FC88|nr:hypothetical protein [Corallococcus sp. BB11-1]MCY1034047.1 hypothetical protein [Corallococcus sp. BB11-1]
MRFAYYQRLSPAEQRLYRQSDTVTEVPLRAPAMLRPRVDAVREALGAGDRRALEEATAALGEALTRKLGVPGVAVEVLETRPSDDAGELHGLYRWAPGQRPRIQVWMRTARRGRVVAFRTFLRTFLHELCHHLDFLWLELSASFHTEGFFQRESSLFRQLLPPAPGPNRREAADTGKWSAGTRRGRR